MKCPHCGYELGDGMLPARCPKCGANLANRGDSPSGHEGAQRAAESRSKVEGLVNGAGQEGPRRGRFAIGILVVVAFVAGIAYLLWVSEVWGGVSVPDVVGWRVERAQSELEDHGLTVNQVTQKDDGLEGFVLSEDPTSSSRVASGTAVTLAISQSRVMPEVVGLTLEDATAAVEAEGVSVEVVEQPSDQAAGTVLSASDQTGATLSSQTPVTLNVARSPQVPAITGLAEAAATSALSAEGLVAQVSYVATGEGQTAGVVVAVDPAEGTALASGSTVTIQVTKDRIKTLEEKATEIVQIIYNCSPIDDGNYIGSNLRPYLSSSLGLDSASDHDVWYSVVKHWQTVDVAGDAFQSLPRTIVDTPTATADSEGNASVTFRVRWDWSRLSETYSGVTSTDTRTVTMTFDDDDLLTGFSDPQTDVPLYTLS